jgi:1-acyl-sn-glycerol-3-phosphate acyltransferase
MLGAICSFIRCFTGVQARWIGAAPAKVQRIYFANHTSHADCMVLLSVLPGNLRKGVRPAGAADYWLATPIRRWFSTRVLHLIPIERNHLTKQNNPIKKLVAALDQGDSLIIFPEGGRGEPGSFREFKSGLYHLSKARPEVELVPIYIDNANRILPKGEVIPIPFLCSVTFGKPLHIQPNENKQSFLHRAEEAVKLCAS